MLPPAASAAPDGAPESQLLDLPQDLLCAIVCPGHCGIRAACNISATCRSLRQAVLSTVDQCTVRVVKTGRGVDNSVLPAFLFARSLPKLQFLRMHGDSDERLTAAELDAVAALTSLTRLDVLLPNNSETICTPYDPRIASFTDSIVHICGEHPPHAA